MSAGLKEASDFDRDWAEPVGDVLRRWIRRAGLVQLSDRQRVWDAWQRALGPDASHTRLEMLKKHVATFVVDSSALLLELRGFRKPELLAVLQREVRTYFVGDIRFRLEKRGPPARPAPRGK